jgi:hypothetical protein
LVSLFHSVVQPGVPEISCHKISFLIDRYVMPGIYSPHLEGCPSATVVPGAANHAKGPVSSQFGEFAQIHLLALAEAWFGVGAGSHSCGRKGVAAAALSPNRTKASWRQGTQCVAFSSVRINTSASQPSPFDFKINRKFGERARRCARSARFETGSSLDRFAIRRGK